MARPLDRKLQARILKAAKEYWQQYGYSPSLEDIKVMAKVSSRSVVNYHLDILEREGRVKRGPGRVRSLRIMEE